MILNYHHYIVLSETSHINSHFILRFVRTSRLINHLSASYIPLVHGPLFQDVIVPTPQVEGLETLHMSIGLFNCRAGAYTTSSGTLHG